MCKRKKRRLHEEIKEEKEKKRFSSKGKSDVYILVEY